MSAIDTIDAEFVDEAPLAVRDEPRATVVATWTPSFAVAVDVAIERKNEKNRFFREVMVAGTHYGVIPGTGTKPALLKGGAEMLLANMGLNPSLSDADPPTLDITGKDHDGEAYIRYRRICKIFRQTGPTENERVLIAQAEGSCSSWESKYRYRNAALICPQCSKPAIIKGKAEYGGGFVCFKKKDGCGAKFADNDRAITGQEVGKVANPDIADMENTILKMADKRALVAATLVATGCSDIFTQDVEDSQASEEPRSERAASASATSEKKHNPLYDRARSLGITNLAEWAKERGIAWNQSALTSALDDFERPPANAHAAAESTPSKAPSAAQRALAMKLHGELGHDDAYRHAIYSAKFGVESFRDLTSAQVNTLITTLQSALDDSAREIA